MIQIKHRMPVQFDLPPPTTAGNTSTPEKITLDRPLESDNNEVDKTTSSTDAKIRQTKVINNCPHDTHTLEHGLQLKGEPINESESAVDSISKSLLVQIAITVVFCVIEFVTGIVCTSIAMLADSYHMAADVMALIVALTCIRIATRPSKKHGYGWVRAETLGGFFNGIFMITVCVLVFQEAGGRVISHHRILHPLQVLIIGACGLAINLIGMFMLNGHGHAHGGEDGHGHSHGGGAHGHSHFGGHGKKKSDEHDEHDDDHENGHGHSHDHDHVDHCSESHKNEEPVANGHSVGKSNALTRLLAEEAREETVERRLSGATTQNAIIATIDRQMTPYGTHIASEVLNGSSAELEPTHSKSKKKEEKNVNVHGVWLHLLSDALGSVIVMVSASVLLLWPDWFIAPYLDPMLSMCLASIMGFTAIVLVKTSGEKLLKQTPKELDLEKVKKDLCSIVGVSKVVHLKVWTLCGQRIIAAAHVNFCHPAVFAEASFKIKKYFHDMGVHSTTIEPTFEDTCMQSMTVMVKKVLNGKSIEEPASISIGNEVAY
ncbi:unnamed protein product [Caenorhabditis sp. 36 PRJEB53466]|nr:unnamed protein product [Caenorhabditis sp. 36 PRJEB53466]